MRYFQRWPLALVLLFLSISNVQSSTVLADENLDQQCRDTAASMQSADGGKYNNDQVNILSGCYQDSDGMWFWPQSWRDARLPEKIVTNEELDATSSLITKVVSQYFDFEKLLESYADSLNAASVAKSNYLISLKDYTSGAISAGRGVRPEYSQGPAVSSIYEQYEPIFLNFMADPNHSDLWGYARWWTQRRIGAMPVSVQQINPMARAAYIEDMGFYRAPWPWELGDDVYLNGYRKWAVSTGLAQIVTTPTPASTATNNDDCSSVAYWAGQTTSRLSTAFQSSVQGELPPHPGVGVSAVFRKYGTALTALADEQQASSPPDSARSTNALFVQGWREYADFWNSLADADEAIDQTAWDQAFGKYKVASTDLSVASTELNQLKTDCGISP